MNVKFLYEKFSEYGKISTDTRSITPGSVFFSLKGEKFNANEFAADALSKGASYAVVDEARFAKSDRYILVDDCLAALQQLARHHRSQFSIPVVGLTGSNGKTTSKELLNAVLSKKYRTLATKGNLNNHIGVPLTVLSITPEIEMAIIEMGANHLGEIALLCDIANPTCGFITNISKAHVGMFGGFENIIRAKSELYQYLINTKGTVFINSQNPILANMAKRFENPLFYPAKGDYFHCESVSADPYLKVKSEDGIEIQTHLFGEYNFENVAVALCVGKYFEVDPSESAQAVRDYRPGNMRSQVISKGTNTIILDAYNANPTSVEMALKSLSEMKAENKVAILGDMFELGDESEEEHKRIGALVKHFSINRALLCGSMMKAAANSNDKTMYFETKQDLTAYLRDNPIRNATILIKASRGMALESVVDFL